jgi:hypothetical protein
MASPLFGDITLSEQYGVKLYINCLKQLIWVHLQRKGQRRTGRCYFLGYYANLLMIRRQVVHQPSGTIQGSS